MKEGKGMMAGERQPVVASRRPTVKETDAVITDGGRVVAAAKGNMDAVDDKDITRGKFFPNAESSHTDLRGGGMEHKILAFHVVIPASCAEAEFPSPPGTPSVIPPTPDSPLPSPPSLPTENCRG